MLYEIFNSEGDRVQWTENPLCVLSREQFLQRTKDGYTIKFNGKIMRTYAAFEEAMAAYKAK